MHDATWWSITGELLLSWHVKGFLLLTATGLVARFVRHRSAAIRHLAWTTGLIALFPLATPWPGAPLWELPVPQWLETSVNFRPGELIPSKRSESAVEGSRRAVSVWQSQAGLGAGSASDSIVSSPTNRPVRREEMSTRFLRFWPSLWLLGVCFSLLWKGIGEILANRLLKRASLIQDNRLCRRVRDKLEQTPDSKATPRLLMSDEIRSPFTRGVRHPVLVLPADYEDWSPAQLDRILDHELAHLMRRDLLTSQLAALATCLHWMNPLSWLALRNSRRQQELACDDFVARIQGSARPYAQDLLSLAQKGKVFGWPLGILGNPSGLEERLRALLNQETDRLPLQQRHVLAGAGVALLVVVLLGGLQFPARASAFPQARTSSHWATIHQPGRVRFETEEVISIEGIGRLQGTSRDRILSFDQPVQFLVGGVPAQPGQELRPNQQLEVWDDSGREQWKIRLALETESQGRGRRVGSATGDGVSFVFEPGEPAFYHLRYEQDIIHIQGWVYRSLEIGAKVDLLEGPQPGLRVRAVLLAGPADRAGLRVGDVITALEAQPANPSGLFDFMASRNEGDTLPVLVRRDGISLSLGIPLRESEPTLQGETWKGRKFLIN